MAGPYWNAEAQRWESGDEGTPAPHVPPPPLPPLPSVPPPPTDPLAPSYGPPSYDGGPGAGPGRPLAPTSAARSLRGWISPFAAGVAVVALALGTVTVWFTVGRSGGDQARTGAEGPQAVQSAESTSSAQEVLPGGTAAGETTAEQSVTADATGPDATATPQVPAGYRLVVDTGGFTIAVPEGWERSLENDRVFYRTADRASLVQVFQVTEAGMTPGKAVRLASQGLRDGTEGYDEIRVGPVDGAVNEGQSAELVYEYDSEESGGRRRGVERVFRVSSGELWAVLVAAPAGEWPRQQKVLDTAIEHFQLNDTF
ncbi:hypothetical protein [Streptomyces flavidovirens]|uniref:hypothetical protein n=1 Tax=Streptomyces flavidovirens TaxID=67298 RepID=UPI00041C4440|nr:hypothetical protein [Streptomyces flavidovirens]